MSWQLARPSFWPEPRDPWAWQRALKKIVAAQPVPDPRPCWEQVLNRSLSRRSVAGLYGLRAHPIPPTVLGIGLLRHGDASWSLEPAAEELMELERDAFQQTLGRVLVQRSAWVRLALRELAVGRWTLPRGVGPLAAQRQMRVGEDLSVPDQALDNLTPPAVVLGGLFTTDVDGLETGVGIEALSALHAPLYLLHTLGWLDGNGHPALPDDLAAELRLESPAAMLRRLTSEEQDQGGYVAVAKVAKRLWCELHGNDSAPDLAAWTDRVIGDAIAAGAIEVQAWAPGQPRHGRGLHGDRDRKLARWTIHDDFVIPNGPTCRTREVER